MTPRPDAADLWEQLGALRPIEVGRYLTANGWEPVSSVPNGQMWASPDAPRGMRLYLPMNRELRDYAERMGDVVHMLAMVARRSEYDILAALSASGLDVYSVRLMPESRSGTIPLRLGARAVDCIRELVLCAAYEAIVPDAPRVQVSPRPQPVRDVLNDALLAQSGVGSYIFTVQMPVEHQRVVRQAVHQTDLLPDLSPPVGRKISTALAEGIKAAHTAVREAQEGLGVSAFVERSHQGASADLCAALAKLGADGELPYELSFGWAESMPVETPPAPISFSPDACYTLEEGAKHLKEVFGWRDVEVRGPIITLNRELRHGPGEATIAALVSEGSSVQQRRVRLHLNATEYDRAIEAHREHDEVSARGVLRRRGNRTHLEDVRAFRRLESNE